MTTLEVKKNGEAVEANLYYNKVKRGRSFYRIIVNKDYNTLLLLLFDLRREGFPVDRAVKEFINKGKEEDWLF